MFFQPIFDPTLAQRSYMIGCQETGEALVIDAQRDVDVYLKLAKKNNLRITHITETHIHADFLCGSRELASVTGAKMYLSDEGGADWQYEFDHVGLKNGDDIQLGNLSFEMLHTPGHTPESISFLLTDHAASEQPVIVFTGDFVFVGDVGRPDLLEEAAGIKGTKEIGARQMFQSLKKFLTLPDYVQVWPAHGAGSACGKALGAVASSTVGYEKLRNWALQFGDDEEGFVKALLAGQPEPPKYFAMMKKLNKIKRSLLIEVPKYPKLSREDFISAYHKGMKLIDTREKADFAMFYLKDSLNIEGGKTFSTWMGWVVNYEEQFMLIASPEQIEDLTRKLMRIGLDNVYGFISFDKLISEDLPFNSEELVTVDQMRNEVLNNEKIQVVDVRGATEFSLNRLTDAINIPVGYLQDRLDQLDKNKEIVVHCESGLRAALAYSILKKNGFKNVKNFMGGMKAWREAVKNKTLTN